MPHKTQLQDMIRAAKSAGPANNDAAEDFGLTIIKAMPGANVTIGAIHIARIERGGTKN